MKVTKVPAKGPRKRPAVSEAAYDAWHQGNEARMSSVSSDMAKSADAVIARYGKGELFEGLLEKHPDEWLAYIGNVVKKLTVKQHIQRVALAYALCLKAESNPKVNKALARTLRAKRQKPSDRTELLHLAVESVITYGDDTPEGKREARRLYSRDVQAIRHLKAQKVLPHQVEALAAEKGQGLDTWARKGKASVSSGTTGSKGSGSQVDTPSKNDNPINVIEWRVGDSQRKVVSLPATKHMTALIASAFYDFELAAQCCAESAADKVVRSATEVVRHLGFMGREAAVSMTAAERANNADFAADFMKALAAFLDGEPGPTDEKRRNQEQMTALVAATEYWPL